MPLASCNSSRVPVTIQEQQFQLSSQCAIAMVRINIPTSYGTLPESPAIPNSGSKTRRIHMFLALASVALCLVVVASVASSSKRLTVELFDASAESGQFP